MRNKNSKKGMAPNNKRDYSEAKVGTLPTHYALDQTNKQKCRGHSAGSGGREHALFENSIEADELLTAKELGERLKTTSENITEWRRAGVIPDNAVFKFNGIIRYRWSKILLWGKDPESMSIHQTKNGFRVRWRSEGQNLSKSFSSEAEARAFASQENSDRSARTKAALSERKLTLAPKKKEILYADVDQPQLTFEAFADEWLMIHGVARKTEGSLKGDKQILRDHLLPDWGSRALSSIEKHDFSLLQALLKKKKLSPKTINNIVGLARKMFSCAVEWDKINSDPGASVKPLKVPKVKIKCWTADDRDRFLTWANENDPELFDVIAVAVFTGMRRGEVQALKREDVDFALDRINVSRSFCSKMRKVNEFTKGKVERFVPMNAMVRSILEKRRNVSAGELMLPFDYDHIVERKFKPAQERAKVKVISFHQLRHTFGSEMAMNKIDVVALQELMGHADLSVTQRYLHQDPERLKGLTNVLLTKRRSQAAEKPN